MYNMIAEVMFEDIVHTIVLKTAGRSKMAIHFSVAEKNLKAFSSIPSFVG